MKNVELNNVLSQRPHNPLYHYTTQRGLLGIIREKQMWVTHTQYLNDRREFTHAVELVREEIRRRVETSGGDSPRTRALFYMDSALKLSPESVNVCVCSFSEERDSLSQWRAYGAGTAGFAIGFPSDLLIAATAKQERWHLVRCIYNPSEQRKVVRLLLDEVLDEMLSGELEKFDPDDEPGFNLSLGGNLRAYLNWIAPVLKDQSFSEEREWRIVTRPMFNRSESFHFREGRSLLIPYCKLPLQYDDVKFRLHEVVIGPTRDEVRSKSSVVSFLMHEGLLKGLEVPVHTSDVPYRDW
jgi:Protein of unknown function (DUF2971)